MAGMREKRFVGFGFGPIQSALFLYEAFRSGNFSGYTVVEIDRELVAAGRENGGRYTVNIARPDRIDRFTVEGVQLCNPQEPEGRRRIVAAVAAADEMCTALPSVNIYPSGGLTSVVSLIAEGLSARSEPLPTIIYTAENHNRAAEILEEHLRGSAAERALHGVQILNTVIGKMSGVITDQDTIRRLSLSTITPRIPRAILVEEFNRILISKVRLAGYRRGIDVFIEKEDLLPFEEAKLYGHNAIHALIAYLADLKGYRTIAEAGKDSWIMEVARRAFVQESGGALIRRNARMGDPLFSEEGYRGYADDLLRRMVNPNLNDLVERVGRDHVRKLGLEDRLYGTMVLALEAGIEPRNLALGAAGGIISLVRRQGGAASLAVAASPSAAQPPSAQAAAPSGSVLPLPVSAAELTELGLAALLRAIWGEPGSLTRKADRLIELTWEAFGRLREMGLF